MSDNYEFTKSSIPQAIDDYSPYIDKQSNNNSVINNIKYKNKSIIDSFNLNINEINNDFYDDTEKIMEKSSLVDEYFFGE